PFFSTVPSTTAHSSPSLHDALPISRFWFSVPPEAPSPNYAQLLLQFTHSDDTNTLVAPLQAALSARVPGARIDVRTVETGPPTLDRKSTRLNSSHDQSSYAVFCLKK